MLISALRTRIYNYVFIDVLNKLQANTCVRIDAVLYGKGRSKQKTPQVTAQNICANLMSRVSEIYIQIHALFQWLCFFAILMSIFANLMNHQV